MKPARLLLDFAFSISFASEMLLIFAVSQLYSLSPSGQHHAPIPDGPFRDVLERGLIKVCWNILLLAALPAFPSLVVYYLDRSQWRTGLGKITMVSLIVFYFSLMALCGTFYYLIA
jgi:hypothetical protein